MDNNKDWKGAYWPPDILKGISKAEKELEEACDNVMSKCEEREFSFLDFGGYTIKLKIDPRIPDNIIFIDQKNKPTMKEEIEKILDSTREIDEYDQHFFNRTEATIQLQKLFLSKQIELLGELQSTSSLSLFNKKLTLEAELKKLEP